MDDFNEFSAIVPNAVDRLHFKHFVKTYANAPCSYKTTFNDGTNLDMVKRAYYYIYIRL